MRLRVRIRGGKENTGETGVPDRFTAGRRLAVVPARFQGHVEIGAPASIGRLRDEFYLRVRSAPPAVPALPNDFSVADGDGPHRRIWRDAPQPPSGEAESPSHEVRMSRCAQDTLPTRRPIRVSGVAVSWLPVDAQGRVVADAVRDLIRPETRLVRCLIFSASDFDTWRLSERSGRL